MSQYDFGALPPSSTSGTDLAEHLKNWRDALHSSHLSASGVRPSYVKAGMEWINAASSMWTVYKYDGANDIAVGTLDTASNKYYPGSSYYNGVIPGVIIHPSGLMDQFGRVVVPAGNGYTTTVPYPHASYVNGVILFSLTYVGGINPGVQYSVSSYNSSSFTLSVTGTISLPFSIDWQSRGI